MTFSYPAGSAQQDVVAVADVIARRQLQDLLAIDGRIEREVEGIQRFLRIQPGAPHAQVELLLGTPLDFILQQPFQKVQVRPLFVYGLALASIQGLQDTGQPQLLEHGDQFWHWVHDCPPSSWTSSSAPGRMNRPVQV